MTHRGEHSERGRLQTLTTLALLCAIGSLLVNLVRFPLLPGATFLKYEPGDVPIFLASLMYGSLPGLAVTVIVCLFQFLSAGSSGLSGLIMHVVATGVAAVVVGMFTQGKKRRYAAAAWFLAAGAMAMTAFMVPLNLLVTPAFLGAPLSTVKAMLLPTIIPFNLLKAGINGALTFALYRALGGWASRQGGLADLQKRFPQRR
jgi:riboflavin transporter FmnP